MPLPGTRVLLVEDETLVAMLTEDMLAGLGCEIVGQAERLAQAMEMALAGGFDIALLDVNLAGEEVFPVADLLAARGTPFVFTTGYGLAGLRPDLRDRPSVTKPFQRRDLGKALEAALG